MPVDMAQIKSSSAPGWVRAHPIQGSKALQSVQLAESIRLGLGLRVSLTVVHSGGLVVIYGEPLFTTGQ